MLLRIHTFYVMFFLRVLNCYIITILHWRVHVTFINGTSALPTELAMSARSRSNAGVPLMTEMHILLCNVCFITKQFVLFMFFVSFTFGAERNATEGHS